MSQAFRVSVGPPDASLAVWIVDPPDGALVPEPPAAAHRNSSDKPYDELHHQPRGTILYLHGIHDRKETLLPTALSHAQRGYRGILVDSRGHGESTGQWLTYGVHESRDYSQLLDELQRRGLLAGKLGIYGCSYGGGVGAQLAGREPRVACAVLLSPFASMRQVVNARAESLGLKWILGQETVEMALARGCEWAGIRADEADGVTALRARPLPLLVIHGREDQTIPCEQGEALCRAAGQRSRLVAIDGATHNNWTRAGLMALWTESTAWLDRWLEP